VASCTATGVASSSDAITPVRPLLRRQLQKMSLEITSSFFCSSPCGWQSARRADKQTACGRRVAQKSAFCSRDDVGTLCRHCFHKTRLHTARQLGCDGKLSNPVQWSCKVVSGACGGMASCQENDQSAKGSILSWHIADLNILASSCNASQAGDTAAANSCCNLLAGKADGRNHSGQL